MMRRWNRTYIASLSLVVIVPVVVWVTGFDPRLAGALTGCGATALLSFRLLESYDQTEAVARAAIFLLIVTLVLSAIGQFQLTGSTVLTVVTYPIIGHRVACILLGVYWPYILGSGTRSPLVPPPPPIVTPKP